MNLFKTPLFSHPVITIDNLVFFLATIFSSLISYFLFGHETLDLAILSVMITFFIHHSKPNNGDYLYTLMWVGIALFGFFIGYKFAVHWRFYIFLSLIAIYYNFTYKKDVTGSSAFPYVVIFYALGSLTSKGSFVDFLYPTLIGSILGLFSIWVLTRQKIDFRGFENGMFSKSTYARLDLSLFLSTIIYIVFLILNFYIPSILKLERGYWSAFAFIFLVTPQIKDLTLNTLYRFGGTLLGAFICVVINAIMQHQAIFLLIPLFLTVFFYPTIIKSPNAILRIAGLTLLVLLLIEYSFFFDKIDTKLPWIRIMETLIGGILATIAGLLIHFSQMIQPTKSKPTAN